MWEHSNTVTVENFFHLSHDAEEQKQIPVSSADPNMSLVVQLFFFFQSKFAVLKLVTLKTENILML